MASQNPAAKVEKDDLVPLCRVCGNDLNTSGERALELCTSCVQRSNRTPTRVTIAQPSYGFNRHGNKKDPFPQPD